MEFMYHNSIDHFGYLCYLFTQRGCFILLQLNKQIFLHVNICPEDTQSSELQATKKLK